MTTPPLQRVRKVEDVDRDVEGYRRERGRTLVQIEQYLTAIAALRSKYARAGGYIDELLEERHTLTTGTPSES